MPKKNTINTTNTGLILQIEEKAMSDFRPKYALTTGINNKMRRRDCIPHSVFAINYSYMMYNDDNIECPSLKVMIDYSTVKCLLSTSFMWSYLCCRLDFLICS